MVKSPNWLNCIKRPNLLSLCLGTLTETVLETTCHGLDVTSTTSTSGTAALSLEELSKVPDLCSWVCTGTTGLGLSVVRVEATTWAHGVGLLVTLTEGRGTAGLENCWGRWVCVGLIFGVGSVGWLVGWGCHKDSHFVIVNSLRR